MCVWVKSGTKVVGRCIYIRGDNVTVFGGVGDNCVLSAVFTLFTFFYANSTSYHCLFARENCVEFHMFNRIYFSDSNW